MTRNCPHCGAKVADGSSRCAACGDPVDSSPIETLDVTKFGDLDEDQPPSAPPASEDRPPANPPTETSEPTPPKPASEAESDTPTVKLSDFPKAIQPPEDLAQPDQSAVRTQKLSQSGPPKRRSLVGDDLPPIGAPLTDDASLTVYWGAAAPNGSTPVSTLSGGAYAPQTREGVTPPRRTLVSANDPGVETADYEKISFVAQGGMGQVFLAKQRSIGRNVALKLLKDSPKYSTDEQEQHREKFLAEASITGELDHPNILPVHDVGVSQDGKLFYSMKFIRGNSWEKAWTRKTLEENLEILLKVSDAVAFAHSREIIHRDLKPENVMLGDFGEVVVADWGLAVDLQGERDFPLSGSVAYAAPEIVTGPSREIGKHSDIYLLGAILFQLVVGKAPHYFSESLIDVAHKAAKNELIPIPPEKEGPLASIALRALATKPRDRYRSVEAFQQALRQYQTHQESVKVANRAFEQLELARENHDPTAFSRAVFGFEDALSLWSGNSAARSGLREAKDAYVHHALETEDYDLGLSIVDPDDPEKKELYDQLVSGKDERDSRRKRLQATRRAAIGLLSLLAVVVTVAGAYVGRQNANLKKQTAIAQAAELRASEKEADAVKATAENEKSIERLREEQEKLAKAQEKIVVIDSELQVAYEDLKKTLGEVESQRDRANTERDRANTARDRARLNLNAAQQNRFLSTVSLIESRIEEDDVTFGEVRLGELAQEELTRPLLGWESHRLQHLLHSDGVVIDSEVELLAAAGDVAVTGKPTEQGVTLSVWRVPGNGEAPEEQEFEENVNDLSVNFIALAPNGRTCAVGGSTLREKGVVLAIYEIGAGGMRRTAEIVAERGSYLNDAAFDASGDRLAVAGSVVNQSDAPIYVIDKGPSDWPTEFKHAKRLYRLAYVESVGTRVAISPDGSQVAGIGQSVNGTNGSVVFWSLDEAKQARADSDDKRQALFTGTYNDVAFSPNGEQIAAGRDDGRVVLWNGDPSNGAVELGGHVRPVTRVAFADDDHLVSSGLDRAVLSWRDTSDEEGGAPWSKAADSVVRLRGHGESVRDSQPLSNGRVLSIDETGTTRFWRTNEYYDDLSLPTQPEALSAQVGVAADGSVVVVADDTGALRVLNGISSSWPAASLIEDAVFVGHEKIADAPNLQVGVTGTEVAPRLVTYDGDTLVLWDAKSGLWLDRAEAPKNALLATRFGGSDVVLGSRTRREWFRIDGDRLAKQPAEVLGGDNLRGVALEPRGEAAAGALGGSVGYLHFYDQVSADRSPPKPEAQGATGAIAYSPDGANVLAAYSGGRVGMWNPATGEQIGSVDGLGSPAWLRPAGSASAMALLVGPDPEEEPSPGVTLLRLGTSVESLGRTAGDFVDGDLSPDGATALLVQADRTVASWRIGSAPAGVGLGNAAVDRYAHIRFVDAGRVAALNRPGPPGAEKSAHSSTIGQIFDWDGANFGAEEARFASRSPVVSVQVAPDGASATTFTASGVVHNWDLSDQATPRLASQFHVEAIGPVTKVVTAGDSTYVFQRDVMTHVVAGEKQSPLTLRKRAAATAGSRGGRLFVVYDDGDVDLFDNGVAQKPWGMKDFANTGRVLLAASDDGRLVAAVIGAQLRVWAEVRPGVWEERRQNQKPNFADATALAISPTPDGSAPTAARIVVGDRLGGVSVWQFTPPASDADNSDSRWVAQQMFGWIAHRHEVATLRFAKARGADHLISSSTRGEASLWPAAESIQVAASR